MKIEVYLDGQTESYAVFEPPESFRLDTTALDDGDHILCFKAIDNDGTTSVRKVNFTVRNGPGISVHGLREDDEVSGEVRVLANAYSSKVGDIFEPMRIETPNPIPTWAWLLFLVVFAWGMWYLGIEYREHQTALLASVATTTPAPATDTAGGSEPRAGSWQTMGKQVYENNCVSCHQADGTGLAGLFPPLAGNPAVLDDDPAEHVSAVLNGVQGKVIDGVTYPSPMPPFGGLLSDEEVAAVVNHERTNWGNNSATVTASQVSGFRD